ncbi:MAG: hypothetical protein R3A51_19295, partial [Nannocystaceae bacterium]
MPFTKIWTAILSVLATAFLAGMFLLSYGNAGGFTPADRAAIRATTEAGVAALAAEIHASPVSRAPTLLSSPRLKEALGPKPEPEGKPPKGAEPEKLDLNTVFVEAANSMLLNEYPQMTVGILDKD